MVRKLLVLGYCAIGSLVRSLQRCTECRAGHRHQQSGKTNTIPKPVRDICTAPEHHCLCGCRQFSIARCADPAFVLLDDKMLDDRTLPPTISMRVLIAEYLMDLVLLEKDEHRTEKKKGSERFHA